MASQSDPNDPNGERALIALVRRLITEKKPFSIALKAPDDPLVAKARKSERTFSITEGNGDCVEWVYVPDIGLVCAKRSSG